MHVSSDLMFLCSSYGLMYVFSCPHDPPFVMSTGECLGCSQTYGAGFLASVLQWAHSE